MEHFIKNIEITNFKSIRHAEVKDCRRVNVFVGYPNVGKSNILEALSLFSIGTTLHDADVRPFLRFENYFNLFHDNNTQYPVQVSLDNLENVRIENQKKHLLIRSESRKMFFEIELGSEEFKFNGMEHVSSSSDNYDGLERLQVKKYFFQTSGKYYPQDYSKELLVPYGENIVDTIKYNSSLRKDVISLFKGFNLKYATDESNIIRIVKEYGDQEVKILPYVQMADTIRRLIFYKAAILSNNNCLLLLEEPESHMFPPYISKMTRDIIYDENGNQFFIATHSPYVLGDLIRDVEPEELSVYIVDYDVAKGETIIHRMNEEEVNEAYQFGHDFFMNINNFIPNTQHEQV